MTYRIALTLLTLLGYIVSLRCQTDLFSFTPLKRYPLGSSPVAASFSRDGKHLAILEPTFVTLVQTGTETAARLAVPPSGPAAVALALSRNGDKVAIGFQDGSIRFLNWGEKIGPACHFHRGRINSLSYSPDGRTLVSVGADRLLIVSDVASSVPVIRLPYTGKSSIRFVDFIGTGTSILGVSESGQILEWDAKRGTLLRQLQDSEKVVHSAVLGGGGTLLALSTEFTSLSKGNPFRPSHPSDFYRENRLKIYDLSKGAVVKQIEGIEGDLSGLTFSADRRFLAGVRQRVQTGVLSVYDLQRGIEVSTIPVLDKSGVALFSPDGSFLAGVSPDGSLALMEVTGIHRSADPGDLAGSKIRITSADRLALINPKSKTSIAVLDFDALGVTESTARAVAAMLRNQLSGSAHVELVERERMERVMTEQNFQNSDRVDLRGAVQLGSLLSTSKMVFGSVSQLGSSYIVSVQVVDVETARIEGIREVLCQRCTLDDLPSAVAELRAALVAKDD
jgi:WD40 repeat protein